MHYLRVLFVHVGVYSNACTMNSKRNIFSGYMPYNSTYKSFKYQFVHMIFKEYLHLIFLSLKIKCFCLKNLYRFRIGLRKYLDVYYVYMYIYLHTFLYVLPNIFHSICLLVSFYLYITIPSQYASYL